jgi:hypothetical protein
MEVPHGNEEVMNGSCPWNEEVKKTASLSVSANKKKASNFLVLVTNTLAARKEIV